MTTPSATTEPLIPRRRYAAGVALLIITACATTDSTEQKDSEMKSQPQTLWQVITRLGQRMPLTPEKIERVLRTPFRIKEQDQYSTQWIGDEVVLLDDLKIAKSSLALGPDSQFTENSGLSIELGGGCVTLEQVRQQFHDLNIAQAPRGHSKNETTVHVSPQPWGQVSFAFRADNPGCLFRVGIRPLP